MAADKLNFTLECIANWLNCSSLQLNVKKKKVGMIFTKRQCNIVPEVKYLGIIINSNLTFKAHILKSVQKSDV